MTYSRPGNSSVSVSSGSRAGNVPEVKLNNRGSKVSASSRTTKYDNVNPDQIYQNGMQKVEQINKFVDFFTDDVAPFIGKELGRRADNELGEFLRSVPPEDVTAAGNQQNIDAMNLLSPLAKDKLIGIQGQQAAAMYPAALQAAYVSNNKVLTPGNSPEAVEIRAIAKAEAKAQALEAVGFNKLPAYQTVAQAESLATSEGRVNGQLFQKQIAQEAALRQNTLVNAGAVDLAKAFKSIQTSAATVEEGKQVETLGTRAYLEGIVKSSGETEGVVTQARLLAGVITRSGGELSPTEYAKLVSDMKIQKNTPLYGVDKKTNLWDVPINDQGDTIGTSLDKWEGDAIAIADEEIYQEKAAEMQKRMIDGDMEGAYAIWASSADLMNDPKYWNSLGNLFTAGQNRVTPQMTRNQNDIEERILRGETTATQETLRLFNSNPGEVSRDYMNKLTTRAQTERRTGQIGLSPDKPIFDSYNGMKGHEDNKLIDDQFQRQLDLNIPASPPQSYLDQPGKSAATWKIDSAQERIDAEADQRDFYVEIYKQKIAEGKPIDELKIYREATARARTKFNEKARKNNTEGPVSPAAALTSKSRTVQKALDEAMIANGGRVTIPISVLGEDGKAKLQAQGKDWGSLSLRQQTNALANTFVGMEIKNKAGESVKIDERKAADMARKMIQNAKKAAAAAPAAGVPVTVPVTEKEVQQTRSGAKISELNSLPGYQATVDTTLNILGSVKDFLMQDKVGFGKEKDNGEAIRQWFNNDGMGDQSMKYVDGFLNMIAGVQPATAAPLMYGTPDGLADFRQAWKYGSQGLKTGPLPQVAASAQARPVPTAVGNDQHELFVMIGVSEGTRTANGGYTKAYYGHSDPGDDNYNRGTVSGGRNSSASPEMVDQKWMGILTNMQQRMRPQLIVLGLMPGTQGYNRVMFNLMDLTVQSPKAAQDFAGSLFGTVREGGFTIEAIAKARADSFINPETGRLEASGFGNNYQTLLKDQRSRAGVYDYRRRL